MDPQFQLAVEGWGVVGPDPVAQESAPAPKKSRLSLSHKKTQSVLREIGNGDNRFAAAVKENEYREAAKGVVPVHSQQFNQWALRAWVAQRKEKSGEEVPSNLLESNDLILVAKFMRFFVSLFNNYIAAYSFAIEKVCKTVGDL